MNTTCASSRHRRCAARLLRRSLLRSDRADATPALPVRPAARDQVYPRSRAQARSGDCCSRGAAPLHPARASAGPGPATSRVNLAGFTLLELMIAVSLGMLIVFTAVSGFRVATTSISTANRLALGNALLRAAFTTALEEVDLWLAYDDPTSSDAAAQKLRSVTPYTFEDGRQQGLPFAPFALTFPGTSAAVAGTPGSESDRGWDSAYAWPSADPRTWWRGNAAEQSRTDLRMGNHALYADTTDASPHPWLFRQMDYLKTALGYQGMCEYLPPNTLYALISSPSRQEKNAGGSLGEFIALGGNPNFRNGDGGTNFAQGRYRCTKDTSFGIVPLHPQGGALPLAEHFRWGRTRANTGSWSNGEDIAQFYRAIRSYEELPAVRPAHWPTVSVSVARYLSHNRFAATCWIRWNDPLTGALTELSFNGFGTTLRGARQQRQPGAVGSGAGWARWYANGDPRNSATLDAPAGAAGAP